MTVAVVVVFSWELLRVVVGLDVTVELAVAVALAAIGCGIVAFALCRVRGQRNEQPCSQLKLYGHALSRIRRRIPSFAMTCVMSLASCVAYIIANAKNAYHRMPPALISLASKP